MRFSIKEIASKMGATIVGDDSLFVTRLAPIAQASKDELTFISEEKYFPFASTTHAKVIIVESCVPLPRDKTYLVVKGNVRQYLPILLMLFKPSFKQIDKMIEDSAEIAKDVHIPKSCYIGHDVKVSKGCKIYPNVSILEGTVIGENCTIYPNVTIREFSKIGKNVIFQPGCVIGSDGFGYYTLGGKHIKIEQIGTVVIHDNVEIGSNTTIDRGAIGDTVVGMGTKIDNLVHIAHNDLIGENCLIIAQTGISGSVTVKNNVTIAGQVGVAGHLTIGENVIVAAKAGISKDLAPNQKYQGNPAQPMLDEQKSKVYVRKLPKLFERVKELEKMILEKNKGEN